MPSETPEPTQEQIERARNFFLDGSAWSSWTVAQYAIIEAAPLREEIERLGSENEDLRDRLSEQPSAAEEILLFQQQRDAAEANVLSLEAEIEKLAARTGEMHREKTNAETEIERQHELYVGAADDTQHERRKALTLEKQLSDALAAASRAREEQGALRAALERTKRSLLYETMTSTQPEDALAIIDSALAPPAAESQENQQQLTKENTK